MVKSVKRVASRTRKNRSMRKQVGKGLGSSEPKQKPDPWEVLAYKARYESVRDGIDRQNKARAAALTRRDLRPESVITSSRTGNPSGISDGYINKFIESHLSMKHADADTKNRLRTELQQNIRYDSSWRGPFSNERVNDEHEQFEEKIQSWLKEGDDINSVMMAKTLRPFKQLK